MPLNDVRSVHLPYVIKRVDDGRYVVLNREYKPLGFRTKDHVDYASYPIAMKLKGLTPKMASRISFDGSDDLESIFLYNDGSIPTDSPAKMKDYLAQLAVLSKLEIAK